MHLLHPRSSVFGGNGAGGGDKNKNKALLRRVGSSPRLKMTRSESIKKKSGGGGGGTTKQRQAGLSKRARLRAGLAAALQELRLSGRDRPKQRGPAGASLLSANATRRQGAHHQVGTPCAVEDGAAVAAAPELPAPSRGGGGGAVAVLLLLFLALACVVALGRAPAVCCCTCAAWWCRRRAPPGHAAATKRDLDHSKLMRGC